MGETDRPGKEYKPPQLLKNTPTASGGVNRLTPLDGSRSETLREETVKKILRNPPLQSHDVSPGNGSEKN